MGVFDYVSLKGSTSDKLRCHYKHVIPGPLQTKGFSNSLDTYVIYNDRLYHEGRSSADDDLEETVLSATNDKLVLQTLRTVTFVPFTGTIRAYTGCEICSGMASHLMQITHQFNPQLKKVQSDWVEFELVIKRGLLRKYTLLAPEEL